MATTATRQSFIATYVGSLSREVGVTLIPHFSCLNDIGEVVTLYNKSRRYGSPINIKQG